MNLSLFFCIFLILMSSGITITNASIIECFKNLVCPDDGQTPSESFSDCLKRKWREWVCPEIPSGIVPTVPTDLPINNSSPSGKAR